MLGHAPLSTYSVSESTKLNEATLAATLDGVAVDIAANVSSAGSLTVTLDGVTVAFSGAVNANQTGTLDVTLDGVTVAFSGSVSANYTGTLDITLDGVSFDASGAESKPVAPVPQPAGAPGRWWKIGDKAFFGTREEAEAQADREDVPKPVEAPKPKKKRKAKPTSLGLVLQELEAIPLPEFDVSLYSGPEADDVARFLASLELQTEQMQALRAELDDEDVILLTL